MLPSTLLLALAIQPATASRLSLTPRHEDDHTHDPQGTDHSHGENSTHGDFTFTSAGITWPTCLRDCWNTSAPSLPESVEDPLCVNTPFYTTVTQCIAGKCTAYEQGAFAVLAGIECPAGQSGNVSRNVSAQTVRTDLERDGGRPQVCRGVDRAIQCENETSAASAGGRAGGGAAWVGSSFVLAVLFGVFL